MAAAAAPTPLTPFPDVYAIIMKQAETDYGKIGEYKAKSAEVAGKIEEWGRLYDEWVKIAPTGEVGVGEAQNQRFWAEVDLYISYRGVREDLRRILDVYQKTIDACSSIAAEISLQTANMAPHIEETAQGQLTKALNERVGLLEERRREIHTLHTTFIGNLLNLRTNQGERLARLCVLKRENAGIFTSVYGLGTAAVSTFSTGTPNFTWAADQRSARKAVPPQLECPAGETAQASPPRTPGDPREQQHRYG